MKFFKKLRDAFNPRPAPTSNVTPSTAQQRPGIGEYRSLYALQSDAAPDWDTIDRALAFVAAPQLPAADSRHGRVEFLQLVGLTSSEMDDIKAKRRTCEEVVNALRQNNPLLITDLDRRG